MWWGFTGPNEFTVSVPFGEDAHKAWLTVEHAAYVGVGDARVAPCGVDSDAHLILIEMCGHGGASRGWWCSWGPRVGGRRF